MTVNFFICKFRKKFLFSSLHRSRKRKTHQRISFHIILRRDKSGTSWNLSRAQCRHVFKRSVPIFLKKMSAKFDFSFIDKTFIGSNEGLKNASRVSTNKDLRDNLCLAILYWSSAHHLDIGGAWEILIKSSKRTLLIFLLSRWLTDDKLKAKLDKTESILNSRYLTNVAYIPDSEQLLTPNLFFLQKPFNSMLHGNFSLTMLAIFNSWKTVQLLTNHIWRHLRQECLLTLTKKIWVVRQKYSGSQNGRHCLDTSRFDAMWHLAFRTSGWNSSRKRWNSTIVNVKSPHLRYCLVTCLTFFGWLAVFFTFSFSPNGNPGNAS